MTCPRCGNEWDVTKSPCGQCGLLVRMPATFRSSARAAEQTPKKTTFSGVMPSVRPSRPFPTSTSASSPNQQRPTLPPTPPGLVSREQSGQGESASSTPPPVSRFEQNRSSPAWPALPSQADRIGELHPAQPVQPSPPPLPRSVRPVNSANAPINNRPLQGRGAQNQAAMRDNAVSPAGFSLTNLPPTPVPTPRTTEQLNPSFAALPRRFAADPPEQGQEETLLPTGRPRMREGKTGQPTVDDELPMLTPGTILRGGRYRLQELLHIQEWKRSMYEVTWLALDGQRNNALAVICEVVVPDMTSMKVQSMLRAATIALTSAGRRARIPAMRDVFADQGRSFFVFEPVNGESLLARMQRTGRAIPEQTVIDCCLQMLDVLEALAQQNPPLVHGLIRPEYIIESSLNKEYMLTNFSTILAGDASMVASNSEQVHLSPYTSPEFARGVIDGRSDLYALVASAYHAVTGSLPTPIGGVIPSAQRLNMAVSARFAALLEKGLHPVASQRYQRVSELRQDLLAFRSADDNSGDAAPGSAANPAKTFMKPENGVRVSTQNGEAKDRVAEILPSMMASAAFVDGEQDQEAGMPVIENLPPMAERNDTLAASLWIGGILLCLLALVIVSRGLF